MLGSSSDQNNEESLGSESEMNQNCEYDEPQNPYQSPLAGLEKPPVAAREIFEGENFRPFRTIWTRPRDTIRSIIAVNPQLHVLLLICLAGVANTLDRASSRNLGDKMSLAAVLVFACVFGPLGGLLSVWISSHLIRWTGDWVGGEGCREHIKAAIAWASVPVVFALPLWIPLLLIFGSEMFTEETPSLEAQPMLLIPLLGIALIEIVLAVWSLVLLCNTIAEVQNFRSAWRGLGNLLLAGLVMIVPIFVIVFGVIFLTTLGK
jgi:hypothetical protein